MQLVHGGDWAGYRAEFGRDPLDFSANVSPLGLPEGVARAITAALPTADRYPDPLCRELRAKLALHEGVPAEQILCGNGAADLIFRLALAAKPRTALVTAPTFAEYATALETTGCTVERHFLWEENDFAVTKDLLNAVHPGTNMVFLCQPNNPTGQLAEPALVEALLRRCEAVGAVLAVDECFLDFLPEGEGLSAKHLLKNSKKLIILKAFTKLYGMAGVRLGYCLCSDTELLARMRAAGQPWAVSSLAQAAGKGGRVGVDGLHILQGQLQGQSGRNIRQGRQRVLPDKGRQQLHRADSAGTLLGEQQGCRRAVRLDVQGAVQQLQTALGQQADIPLPPGRRKAQIFPRLVQIDVPGRCLHAGIQRRQRKAARFVQCVLQKQVELGQWVGRVRLRHPEVRPRNMSSPHGEPP